MAKTWLHMGRTTEERYDPRLVSELGEITGGYVFRLEPGRFARYSRRDGNGVA
jgi:hypothetical protein